MEEKRMQDKKTILIFLDLEGTILEEETGRIQKDRIEKLLDSLNRLENATGSVVNIHIASPVSIGHMERILDELNSMIVKYNTTNQTNLREVESAVAYPDVHYIHQDALYDKIFPMKIKIAEDGGRFGKLDYVRNWVESMEDKIDFILYGGNGLNDTGAMGYVKSTPKGLVICPHNSHNEVKKIADYVSEYDEAEGIQDGIEFIIKQREKRKGKEQVEDGTER